MSKYAPNRRAALGALGTAMFIAAGAGPESASAAVEQGGAIAAAVEALRAAMISGDGRALAALVSDHLTYGHSDGRVQDKTDFLESLAGKNAFKSIELSKQTIAEDGDVAWVRHVFDAVNNLPDGKTSTAHILVLQVWKRENGAWKLFARQAASLKT